MLEKFLCNLVPTITFQGSPAKVKSIDFRMNDGEIVVMLADGRLVSMNVTVQNVKLVQDVAVQSNQP